MALLGGTGRLGMGLAARWAENHRVYIGSRNRQRAKFACQQVASLLRRERDTVSLVPRENYDALQEADVVVICIPYEQVLSTVRSLIAGFEDQIVISPMSPIVESRNLFNYLRPSEGSAAMQLYNILPETVKLVSALHNLPASKLLDIGTPLQYDIPIFTDSGSAKKKVSDLIRDIRFLRPVYGGPLEFSALGEMLAALWRNVGRLNKMDDPSVKFLE